MNKKKHKKQKRTRETQFTRYAAQFWRELETAFAIEGIRIDRHREKMPDEVACTVLAKRLYDFAVHVTDNMQFTFAKDIPDLDEKRVR